MAASRRRVRLSREKRRAQLARCAVRVSAEKGLGRVVHADVASEAGVSVPTVFLYFRNRGELVRAVIDEVDAFYMRMAREHHRRERPPLEALLGHFQEFADSVDEAPDFAMVWLEWSTLVRNDFALWDAFLDFQERVIRILARSIRACQKEGSVPASLSAPDSARLLTASSYALAQLKLMRRSRRLIQRYMDQTVEMALHPLDD